MDSKNKKNIVVGCLLVSILTMIGCGPFTNTVVQLKRDRYICAIDPNQFIQFQGKRILLSSITDESKNTTNLAYYNPERTVGYQLFYSKEHEMQQPVVSYFWYALQKAFECAGIKIEEHGKNYDVELSLIINSLTDEEMKFRVLLIKKGTLAHQRDYVVTTPKVQTKTLAVLEKRAYGMLDSIVLTILNDPDFQKAFF